MFRIKFIQRIVLLLILIFSFQAFAQTSSPLPVDQAFHFSSAYAKNGKTLVTTWDIVPGYYLYKNKFNFSIISASPVKIAKVNFPKTAFYKIYPTGEKMLAFTGQFKISLPLIFSGKHSDRVKLKITYQGCSELGVCYPEQTKIALISLSGMQPTEITTPSFNLSAENKALIDSDQQVSQQGHIVKLLQAKSLTAIIAAFFVLGLLLSLTPCVLPMIPILSGIIIGQKKITHLRSFILSLIYVFAMALTYAILGVIVGLIGSSIQAALQTPWVIVLFSLIFVAMALSLFGLYNLQLPEALRHKVAVMSNHQKHGSYLGTAIMGCLSTLILSPCVTPPLAGAIVYIGDKGDAALGAIALFSMGIGMGIPLLIIGASSAKLLPKAGKWMNVIKSILGVMMLGVAIWMIERIIPASSTMVLWAALFIGCAIALGAFTTAKNSGKQLTKALGIILFIYGVLLMVGAILGHTNPLNPIQFSQTQQTNANAVLNFTKIKNIKELNQKLKWAKMHNQPVMLDFYADWCVACHEMDAYTFTDTTVKKLLQPYLLLRADVTNNDKQDKALEKKYQVVAPPTILFFYPNGRENTAARIVGEISSKKLIPHLQKIQNKQN